MKIAVYHNLPSGGAKRTLCDSIRRLGAKHQIDVYTLSSANHNFADLRPHVNRYEVSQFQPLRLLNSPFGRINQIIRVVDVMRLRSICRGIARVIEQGHYDLAYVQPCQYEKAPSILGYLSKLPSVYYCHEPLRLLYEKMPARPYERHDSLKQKVLNRLDPLPALYHKVLRSSDRRNIHCASKVLVNSTFTQNAVRDIYGIDAEVSYHGVDAQFFRPMSIEKSNMLLSVGSLTPLKGFDFLIQAISRIPEDLRPPLVIASNFQNLPERYYLESLAQDLAVDIKLLVNIPDAQLVELYNQARVTVYAPVREPFGLVPLESLACSTPVVAVREGGIQETVVHGSTGLLVEGEPEQFAEAVASLLSNTQLAERFGRNGREHILGKWTWDRAVTTLEGYLSSCTTKNKHRAMLSSSKTMDAETPVMRE